jgi:drug/metabolite transporter (DMT)-like permease
VIRKPASWIFRKGALSALRQPAEVWALGIFGLFGYHALYFFALRLAPPAESGLINYLWPLLIVLFSAFLPGEKLKPHHLIGAGLGLVGTIVLVTGRAQLGFAPEFLPGYCAAFVAAFVWAIYSVLSRRFAAVPTDAVVKNFNVKPEAVLVQIVESSKESKAKGGFLFSDKPPG